MVIFLIRQVRAGLMKTSSFDLKGRISLSYFVRDLISSVARIQAQQLLEMNLGGPSHLFI